MAKKVRISLANKCQLLFGAAVLLIIVAALAVVWGRMRQLVEIEQVANARSLAQAWLLDRIQLGGAMRTVDQIEALGNPDEDLTVTLVERVDFGFAAAHHQFIAQAIERFESTPSRNEFARFATAGDRRFLRYAKAIRQSDLARLRGGGAMGFSPTVDASVLADPLDMILVIQLFAGEAEKQLAVNLVYVIGAGLLASLLAIGAFWFITTRIILSPVRVLRQTAEQVARGDLNIRADINTGDEFEQLATMFNQMLENLKSNQDQLRHANKSLDLKLGELAEANVSLFEANKLKSEFLANVSHELRTPLNSIIGFAEVLGETLRDRTGPVDEKRKRYASNIVLSSRQLLDLINDLLDLAKIEAGRMELRIGPVSIRDTGEALLTLMRPQAEKKSIELSMSAPASIPLVQTDAGKLHQILGNFLSNAVKFTPPGGSVTLKAELAPDRSPPCVKISVIDTGPGIPSDQQEQIFEKFTQLDSTVTREHTGTGLGLTISRELAELLQGEIQLDSRPGRGAAFSLIIPVTFEEPSASLMPALTNVARG